MRVRRALAIAVIANLAGCKTDDAKPAAPAARPAPPRPAPPARPPVAAPPAELLDIVLLREPRLPNATPLAPLQVIEERERVTQSWCIPGSDAHAIAVDVAAALTTAGWVGAAVRGTPARAAASATADGVTLSITVGGVDATCTGLVASATYTTSTFTIPPLEEGERIH